MAKETVIPVFDHSAEPNVGRMPPWVRHQFPLPKRSGREGVASILQSAGSYGRQFSFNIFHIWPKNAGQGQKPCAAYCGMMQSTMNSDWASMAWSDIFKHASRVSKRCFLLLPEVYHGSNC